MRPHRGFTFLGVALSALAVAACGGASDSVDGESSASAEGGGVELSLVAFAVPKIGFEVRVELRDDRGEPLSAQVTRGEASRLDLTVGQSVYVRPGQPAAHAAAPA